MTLINDDPFAFTDSLAMVKLPVKVKKDNTWIGHSGPARESVAYGEGTLVMTAPEAEWRALVDILNGRRGMFGEAL